jgi:Amino acid permease
MSSLHSSDSGPEPLDTSGATTEIARQPTKPAEHDGRHRLTASQGLAALSLDAMASVAYGPEAIVLVLAWPQPGPTGWGFTLPVTLAIAALLAVLVASYRQVIAAFPNGGGAYAVSRKHLGRRAGLVAAASLIVDYILNVAVSVTAGVAALTSAFPSLYPDRVWLCLAVLALVTAVNLRGIAESAKPTARCTGTVCWHWRECRRCCWSPRRGTPTRWCRSSRSVSSSASPCARSAWSVTGAPSAREAGWARPR